MGPTVLSVATPLARTPSPWASPQRPARQWPAHPPELPDFPLGKEQVLSDLAGGGGGQGEGVHREQARVAEETGENLLAGMWPDKATQPVGTGSRLQVAGSAKAGDALAGAASSELRPTRLPRPPETPGDAGAAGAEASERRPSRLPRPPETKEVVETTWRYQVGTRVHVPGVGPGYVDEVDEANGRLKVFCNQETYAGWHPPSEVCWRPWPQLSAQEFHELLPEASEWLPAPGRRAARQRRKHRRDYILFSPVQR